MVSTGAHGQIFTCESCNKIHLEFMNTGIDFKNIKLLGEFYDYLNSLDVLEYERQNKDNLYHRKVIIPFPYTTVKLMLTAGETDELKLMIKQFLVHYKNTRDSAYFPVLKSSKDFPAINLN